MPSSRVMMRLVSVIALGSVFAVSASAATPARSTTPVKKHPHRRPYVRPGETAPAVPSQPGGSGVEVINGTNVRTEYFPAETQGNASQTRVEVINGSVRHTQVFETDRAQIEKKHAGKEVAAAAQPAYSVKIINGNQWETRAFSSGPEKTESTPVGHLRPEPAVVGISSSESEIAETNRKPVVVGIASSESQNADKTAPVVVQVTSNGSDSGHSVEKPVVTGVSPPQPKRPPYRGPGNQQ